MNSENDLSSRVMAASPPTAAPAQSHCLVSHRTGAVSTCCTSSSSKWPYSFEKNGSRYKGSPARSTPSILGTEDAAAAPTVCAETEQVHAQTRIEMKKVQAAVR